MAERFARSMAMLASLSREAARRQAHCAPFLLQFKPLRGAGDLAFPCDAAGRVELDSLTDRERNNYLFARAACGRDYDRPQVVAHARSAYAPDRGQRSASTGGIPLSY